MSFIDFGDMNVSFKEYMADVYSQLECNMSAEDKAKYVCYTCSEQTINENLDYFRYCHKSNLSAYKALLWFHDYLEDKK